MNENKQPSFGILRAHADIKLPSKKKINSILNNPESNIDIVKDLEERLRLHNLWKRDQIIHDIQFKKIINIDEIEKPQVPKKFLGLIDDKKDPKYIANMKNYNQKILEIENTNRILSLYKSIFENQKYECYFCGFYDGEFIEIHHKNGNHDDESPENLVGACTLCHRQHHLLWLSQNNHAELGVARIDKLSQTEFNHMQRISIVMQDNPDYKDLLGTQGKLGSIIQHFSNNFSKPLHAFMIPESKKIDAWNGHVQRVKVSLKLTGLEANYELIELAVRSLDKNDNDNDKNIKNALEAYDELIKLKEKKDDIIKKNPQAPDPTDSIRLDHKTSVASALEKYKKDYDDQQEDKFNKDNETLNLFELSMALKDIEYKHYKSFNPKYMFLVFNPSIFSQEQIAYYKKLEYFDVNNWGYGDQ